MSLAPGTRLGPYEILAPLGAGGMGEVYRARDGRLNRDVALKILPEAFATDPDRLARFRREAHVLAALNHPNIGHIYGIEDTFSTSPWQGGASHALILELVEGPTLADRIAQGPISIADALPIAKQIADALDAAHEQGVIHRDLKPANVKVRDDGTVKVLDFGLAKMFDPRSPVSTEGMNSPTVTAAQTERGMILGTAAYMAPEQAKGKAVDKRADIWSFGVVLYEMLTGRRPFRGESVSDTLAEVLKTDPDWTALPAPTPAAARRLLRRCLERDVKQRLRDIADARVDIEEALAAPGASDPAAGASARAIRGVRLPWALASAAVFLLVAMATVGYVLRAPTDTPRVVRFSVPLPNGWSLSRPFGLTVGAPTLIAVSPDGQSLAFAAMARDGKILLWLHPFDSLTARPLSGTDNATSPFWSPDGRFLAFFADGKLKKLDLSGGPPVTICAAPDDRGGSWSRDGTIIFALSATIAGRLTTGLQQVPASGGVPTAASTLADGETSHVTPIFLPDGRHFLYRALRQGEAGAGPIYVASLDSAERTRLLDATATNVAFSRGHLLFMREGVLAAQAFDPRRLTLTGEAMPVGEAIQIRGNPAVGVFSATDGGVLAYQPAAAVDDSQLTWFDRTGTKIAVVSDPGGYAQPELSSDGKRAAIELADPVVGTRNIWLIDLTRSVRTRFTFDRTDDGTPMWSPDGSQIAFESDRGGALELYQKAANGVGAEHVLLADHRNKFPSDWSPDGRFLLYMVDNGSATGWDLWALPLSGDRKPFPFVQTPFIDTQGRFSPDGHWVVYASGESGRDEVYVAPFPSASDKWQVSSSGGWWPRWAQNGKEIFYLAPDNELMVVSVRGQGAHFETTAARLLFKMHPVIRGRWPYDVSPDGQRFLVNAAVETSAPPPITVVVNWAAALKK